MIFTYFKDKFMKTYKTEIELNPLQQEKFLRTIGVCRFVYNLFLQKNKELYTKNKDTNLPKYINNFEFSKWLNNEFIPDNPEYQWIKEVSSKAVRHAIDNANKAFAKFFAHKSNFPRFKKKNKNDCSMYFVKTDKNTKIKCERHRIKIPTLGWCKLKEFGYIPTDKTITNGTIIKYAGRFYISVLTDEPINIKSNNSQDGIGIDLGVKDFAILSDNTKYKTLKQTKLNKRLKREQKAISKKYETKKKNKKEVATCKNIEKQILRVQKIYRRIANTRNDYQNKIISEIIKREPSFITIEDLNVRGMLKNRHLSKAIANQGFNQFVSKLQHKCVLNGIELRQVDRFYPSSKICSDCGKIKQDLKLSDRIYICECGNIIDRDLNAAINLKYAKKYKVIA